jgi:hypothetical protein
VCDALVPAGWKPAVRRAYALHLRAAMKATIVLLLLSAILAAAPAEGADNAVYFELGGSGVIPTINYERRLTEHWFARGGFSIVTSESEGDDDTEMTVVVPLTASWVNRPQSNHHLELGGGVLFAGGDEQELYDFTGDDDDTFSSLFVTGIAGYRYQRPGRGFQFRAVFTPVVGGGDVLPWAGVSFGYAW